MNFNALGLKKLIATSYDGSSVAGTELAFDGGEEECKAHKIIIDRPIEDYNEDGAVDDEDVRIYLQKFPPEVLVSDDDYKPGDFRSRQCIELLKEADIVVTNPPFSLFREYVAQLVEYNKGFLIIGNMGAMIYREIFPLLKNNLLWPGFRFNHRVNGKNMTFLVPDDYPLTGTELFVDENGKKYISVAGTGWFTNLDINKRHEFIDLYKTYSPDMYPKYDNYNAIEVSKTAEIPMDYDGIMGVPISFIDKYNPEQFEIIWQASGNTRASAPKDILQELGYTPHPQDRGGCGIVKGERVYSRILIRNKHAQKAVI